MARCRKAKLLIIFELYDNFCGLGTLQARERKVDPIPSLSPGLQSAPLSHGLGWRSYKAEYHKLDTQSLGAGRFRSVWAPGGFPAVEHRPLHAAPLCRRRSRQKSYQSSQYRRRFIRCQQKSETSDGIVSSVQSGAGPSGKQRAMSLALILCAWHTLQVVISVHFADCLYMLSRYAVPNGV